MLSKKLFILAFAFICTVFSTSAWAVPNLINYKGVLNDGSGQPLSATIAMTFSIYDTASEGNLFWNETQNVPVADGLFSVQLGSVQQLSPEISQQDSLYLGIQIGEDSEMVPRQQITSAVFAIQADNTPNDDFIDSLRKIRKWVLFEKKTMVANGTSISFSSMPSKKRWKLYLQAAHQNPIGTRNDPIFIYFNNEKSALCSYSFYQQDLYGRHEYPDQIIHAETNTSGQVPLVYSNGYYTAEDFVEFDFIGNLASPHSISYVNFLWKEQIGGKSDISNKRFLKGFCQLPGSNDAVTEIEIAKDINDWIIVTASLYYLDDVELGN